MGTRAANRDSNRQAVVDAGLERMLAGSMAMLRSALNASALSADADMAKDTTYRLFNDGIGASSDAIVREVATASTNPEWSGFARSAEQIAAAFQRCVEEEQPFDEAIITAMAANVEQQFRSPGCPVGWIFHAAALTSSPAWKGRAVLSEDDLRLGRELLQVRARFYERMTDDLLQIMTASMSLINRRPRRGMSPRQLLAILHAMIDGAVLRRYIEPDIFDSRMIGESVYALAMAFSEDGTLSDPRRPSTAEGDSLFDALLERAVTAWEADSERTVDSTAQEAGVATDTAHLLFPSLADLADAVVWSKVLGGGSLIDGERVVRAGGSPPGTEMALVLGLLRRLRDVVDGLPGAVAVIRSQPPKMGIGVRAQLELEIAEVVGSHCSGVDPVVTARELVNAAFAGQDGWATVTSLIHVLEHATAV